MVIGEIIIVGNARCYHTMDWYRTIKRLCAPRKVLMATDLIDSEGHLKMVCKDDYLINLYNIDWVLMKKQSVVGNLWRNFVKFLVSPIQVLKIRFLRRKYPNAVFHAHTMYYMFLCWLARTTFIGTPQGSEILVRPNESLVYKFFAKKSLRAAKHISVDSVSMQARIKELCGRECIIIQNGIDVSTILAGAKNRRSRSNVTSIRGMYPIYRLEKIIEARANTQSKPPLTFIYPFWEETYKKHVLSKFSQGDNDFGRVSKEKMFELFYSTLLAISIPISDSSPRSVYEAIFCGCCVAVTYNTWIENLPLCMKSRLYIAHLEDSKWMDRAIEYALLVTKEDFVPSQAALNLFDQEKTIKSVTERFYNHVFAGRSS